MRSVNIRRARTGPPEGGGATDRSCAAAETSDRGALRRIPAYKKSVAQFLEEMLHLWRVSVNLGLLHNRDDNVLLGVGNAYWKEAVEVGG